MKIRPLIFLACLGILIGIISVIVYNEKVIPQPPIAVSYNPYEKGIYATGIIESYQSNASNINIYPQVAGTVTKIFVTDGQTVAKNSSILSIDDSIQKQTVIKDIANIKLAHANLINVFQQYIKIKKSYQLAPDSVSKNLLDNALNAVKINYQTLKVAKAQYRVDRALLEQYIIKSPIDGTILRVTVATGGYASPQGTYDSYTQTMLPVVQMGNITPELEVRCYLDEILVPELPDPSKFEATMFIRGMNNKSIPLEFVNIQPFTIPNIQLSDARNERVDVRVLPIIFKFKKPNDINVYPGQLVDIYIKGKK